MDGMHPGPGQLQPRELVDVGVQAVALTGPERIFRPWQPLHEHRAHFRPHFECVRSDGGPEPGEDVGRRAGHPLHHLRQHPGSKPPPAGVRCRDDRALAVAEQYRQTVGGQHGAHAARTARDRRIGAAATVVVGIQHVRAVHLVHPPRFRRQTGAQQRPVGRHGLRIVADMRRRIETVERRATDTTEPRRDAGLHGCRRRPVGQDERQFRHHAPSFKEATSPPMSSGMGTSQPVSSPVRGWISPSRQACSACREKRSAMWRGA